MKNLSLSVRVTPDERELLLHFATAAHLSLSNYLRITALSKTSYRSTHAALSLKIGEAHCLAHIIQNQFAQNGAITLDEFTDLTNMIQEITTIAQQLME
jgi:hypothetical protein